MQLTEDCFAFGGALLTYADALAALRQAAAPLAVPPAAAAPLNLSLQDAPGRIVSAPIRAQRNVPAFDNSAVDGYAFLKDPGLHSTNAQGGQRLHLQPQLIAAGARDPLYPAPWSGRAYFNGGACPIRGGYHCDG